MKIYIYILTLGFILFSCSEKNKKNIVNTVDCKFDNGISYTIKYPEIIYKDSVNYLEINNYKSSFDSIRANRVPVLFLIIEDHAVGEDIFKLINDKNVAYVEYSLEDSSRFKIPQNLLENKSGANKITVAIMDVHVKNLEEIDVNNDDENVRMGYIEARSAFDIKIQ